MIFRLAGTYSGCIPTPISEVVSVRFGVVLGLPDYSGSVLAFNLGGSGSFSGFILCRYSSEHVGRVVEGWSTSSDRRIDSERLLPFIARIAWNSTGITPRAGCLSVRDGAPLQVVGKLLQYFIGREC